VKTPADICFQMQTLLNVCVRPQTEGGTLAQEFWDEQKQQQLMEKVINFLKRYNIDFTVDDDKVLIMGNVRYVYIGSFPTISIWQGNNVIAFDEVVNQNKLVIRTPTRSELIILPKSVYAYYEHPFLVLHF